MKWLVLGELIIILIIVVIYLIRNYIEKRKVDKILKFFDKRLSKEESNNIRECVNIIRKNKGES